MEKHLIKGQKYFYFIFLLLFKSTLYNKLKNSVAQNILPWLTLKIHQSPKTFFKYNFALWCRFHQATLLRIVMNMKLKYYVCLSKKYH